MQRPPAEPLDTHDIAPLWRLAERVLLCCGLVNLVFAALIWLFGAHLHPIFSDRHSALLFLVTAVGLLAHALLLSQMRRRLADPGGEATRMLRRAHLFMRLPLNADFAAARRLARLRISGRPLGHASRRR